ncbi:T9SS type A sorting domain-containing protein [Psychroserpens sp. XS_ASV72]|uniref:T9SS type A sorting domain-containing protein n=1 Tax=Psychroserpens sp. XS_ASV72 TaxID=3241293 RepID=UPI00351177E8
MKKITLLLFSLIFCFSLNAQVLSENFDALALPAGWSNEYVSATVDWQFTATNQNGTVAPRNGAGMAAFWSNNYNSDATRLVTPSMDLSTLPSQVLSFYYTQEDWGGDQDVLRVYYKTSAAGAWVLLAEFLNDTNPVWTEVNLVLPNPSADYYIAFEGTSGYGRGITVDDLVIDDAPSCLTPGSLSVFATSPTEADLRWVAAGTETDFDYEYGAPGFTVENSEEIGSGSVTAESASISGLTAGTDYEFYVRANCGGDGNSSWAGPFAWTQADAGESCGTAFVATLEADCGVATPITLDFTGAPSNISTSCDTFNNYGLWVTATTDANGGLTVNASDAVDMAVYDMCGSVDIACYNAGIDPSVDLVLSPNTQYYLYFWQEGTGSTAMVDICISSYSPLPAPNCAEAPISPADMATGVLIPNGELTLTWTAPSAGPAPTDYEFFFGTASGTLVSLGFVGSTDTFIDLINLDFETTYYWSVVPYNGSTPAVGPCAEWSFTTEDAPPPPSNDDCSGAIPLTPGAAFGSNPVDGTVVSATADAEAASCGLDGPGVWYSVVVPGDGNITIETGPDAATSNGAFDSVIEAFSGTCGSLVSIDCDDDGADTGNFSILNLTGRTPGETIYVRVWEYLGDEEEPFSVSAHNSTLSTVSFENENAFTYFPNPVKNELTLKAQSNIQNISVYNMLGQEVLRTAPKALETNLDMNSLGQGAYFVKVTINDVTETVRVIKQ